MSPQSALKCASSTKNFGKLMGDIVCSVSSINNQYRIFPRHLYSHRYYVSIAWRNFFIFPLLTALQ